LSRIGIDAMLTGIKRHYKCQGREVNAMALAGDGMQPWLHRAFLIPLGSKSDFFAMPQKLMHYNAC
jgi:hypothetical protein